MVPGKDSQQLSDVQLLPRFDEMTMKSLEVDCSFATATRLQVSEKPTPKGVIGTNIGSQ